MKTFITENCTKNINFDYIFEQLKPITGYGINIKRTFQPFLPGQEEELLVELNKVEVFLNNTQKRREAIDILKEIRYIGETLQRAKNNVVLDEVELFEVKKFIIYTDKLERSLRGTLSIYNDLKIKPMPHLYKALDPLDQKLISFFIYDEYTPRLKSIRQAKRSIELAIGRIKTALKKELEERYEIKLNMKDEVIINKSQTIKVDKLKNEANLRISGENYLSIIYKLKNNAEIDKLENQLEAVKTEEAEEELSIKTYLTQQIKKAYDDLMYNAQIVGKLDYIIAKANFAQKHNLVMPQLTSDLKVEIKNGRNLKLEDALNQRKKKYTPISVNLNKSIACITGANMGGKTISLRMVGQIIAAVAYGMFVPCESAKVCLFNHIHISVGDDQSIEKGLSTFGAEIVNLKKAIENSDKRSLILIDELAGGTNPKEGFAITKAVVEYLKATDCLSIFTTHYDNIANDEDIQNLQVRGLKLPEGLSAFSDIDEISKYMDYSLVEVINQNQIPQDALNIAKLAGIPQQIINRATQIVNEKNGGNNAK